MTYSIVQIVVADETGDTRYRMKWPAEALAKQDPSLCVINVSAFSPERYQLGLDADLLVLFQTNDLDFLDVIKKRKAKGLKTLVEYNDNFYAPQPWSPVAKAWSAASLHESYEVMIKNADGLLVTGPGLYDLFSEKFSTPVHILENHLPHQPEPFANLQKKKTPYPSFGWAGSLGHMADLLAIKPVITSVLQQVPGSVFHVMGNESIPQVLGIPKDRIRYTPWGGMNEYYAFWESVWVGVAPLLATPYNECRSDIKIIEMGSRAVSPVVSPLLPYDSLVKSLNLPSSASFIDLAAMTAKLLRSGDERMVLAEKLYAYVSSERLLSGRRERLELYRGMLPQKSSSALLQRFGSGFHELHDASESQTSVGKFLAQAQELLNQKKHIEVKKLLEEGMSSYAFHPDVRLAYVRVLKFLKDDSWQQHLDQFRRDFPLDVRGITFGIKNAPASSHEPLWREALAALAANGPLWASNAQHEFVETMMLCLAMNSDCIKVAEELLLIYPHKQSLRQAVASVHEVRGETNEASAHFELLLESRKRFDDGERDIDGIDRGYLEAMHAALKARVKGTLS